MNEERPKLRHRRKSSALATEETYGTEDSIINEDIPLATSNNKDDSTTNEVEDSLEVPDHIVKRWLNNFDGLQPDTYWLTRIVLIRAVAFIFVVAFLVAYNQNKQLIGDRGLLPLRNHMKTIQESVGGDGWWIHRLLAAPTLLWLAEPWTQVDLWLDVISLLGLVLSITVLVTGAANFVVLFTLWLLYHSLVTVGQIWYSFGWESQLLETSLLLCWGLNLTSLERLPWTPPSYVTIYGLRWLLFRIMMGSGLIKIRGDRCWKELTCMDYHYESQPVPNPLSWLLHHSPPVIHQLEVCGNHVVELLVPWLMVGGHRLATMVCGTVQLVFQFILILSGNLSFLNWLTMVPSLALFDDRFYSRFCSSDTREKVVKRQILSEKEHPKVQPGLFRDCVNIALSLLLLYLSLPVAVNLLTSRQTMNISYDSLRILNTYGAFGSVTRTRQEVVLEGLSSNGSWLEYEFKCKPGDVTRRPCVITPYHYRLDWLMWFAAMQPAQSNPWLFHLLYKLVTNEPAADHLMLGNPFSGGPPPTSVRALLYRYQYTVPFSGGTNGTAAWYTRSLVQSQYIPPMDLPTLHSMADQMDWI